MVHYYDTAVYLLSIKVTNSDSSVVQPVSCSGVEGKHTLMVASDEKSGWKVLGQDV